MSKNNLTKNMNLTNFFYQINQSINLTKNSNVVYSANFGSYDNLTDTEEGQNNDQGDSITILGLEFTPYMDFLLTGENVGDSTIWFSNVSEQEIIQNLSSEGEGFGAYSLNITVDSEEGGAFGCNHNDEGEEIQYSVEIGILNFTITSIDDTSDLEEWDDHSSSE